MTTTTKANQISKAPRTKDNLVIEARQNLKWFGVIELRVKDDECEVFTQLNPDATPQQVSDSIYRLIGDLRACHEMRAV